MPILVLQLFMVYGYIKAMRDLKTYDLVSDDLEIENATNDDSVYLETSPIKD